MTTATAPRSRIDLAGFGDPPYDESVGSVLVEVLACGDLDRGDDGASIAALAELTPGLPADVTVRHVGKLGIDDLLTVPSAAGAVVVDTASGVDPGWVVEIPFSGFAGGASGIRARSSESLSRPETVGVASMIRGRPLTGVLVAIGGASFNPGDSLSWPVASGLSSFRVAIADAIERVRAQILANAPTHA